MRRLKVLGVYQCQLIHLGDTMRLLEILRENRGSGMTKNIELDFYPRFHVGPVENGKSYGVTWDNFRLDSRLAIWQIISRAMPQAKKQGVDLFGPDAAFRFWLEKSPCWRVADTLWALDNEKDMGRLVAQLDFPNTWGKQRKVNCGEDW
jgi:hypothetical protein